MGGIKAIETMYNGYHFRSRLEARWAVFFDTLGIEYVYEKEGYDLGKPGWYLPDFWLPQVEMWAEVKPVEFTYMEKEKYNSLVIQSGYGGLMLIGVPETKPYTAVVSYWDAEGYIPISLEGFGCGGVDGVDSPVGYIEYYLTRDSFNGDFFYSQEIEGGDDMEFDDTEKAVNAARSARFEKR